MSEVTEIANTALFQSEQTAHAERAGNIEGETDRTGLIGALP